MTSQAVPAKSSDENQIRLLIEAWRNALSKRDLDRMVQSYAPNVLFFDVVPPIQLQGAAAYRKAWEQMLPHLPTRVAADQRELEIKVSGNLAIVHCLTRLIDADTKESAAAGWVRVTMCFERENSAWRVIHEHVSVPFDPMTGKAVLHRGPQPN